MADTIWICEKQTVNKWDGDILSYKEHLKTKVMKASKKNAKGVFTIQFGLSCDQSSTFVNAEPIRKC